ncbi:MAG TPA: hypothetical protein VIM58_12480 [Candidatus Methylacidiphilales bacterium]
MNVLLFGATGMVGRGVLRECLLDPGVVRVRSVGRTSTGYSHPKLEETILPDVGDLAAREAEVSGFDACFFCLGVSSVGMKEEDYRRLTYDLTLAVARRLARLNPGMTFIYVSGTGTDSTEKGRTMWARVKGKTENDLLRLPFRAVYLFRPGAIEPLHGIRSRTPLFNALYTVLKPFIPLLRKLFPAHIVTTEEVGRAMINAARSGAPRAVVEIADIRRLATPTV